MLLVPCSYERDFHAPSSVGLNLLLSTFTHAQSPAFAPLLICPTEVYCRFAPTFKSLIILPKYPEVDEKIRAVYSLIQLKKVLNTYNMRYFIQNFVIKNSFGLKCKFVCSGAISFFFKLNAILLIFCLIWDPVCG